MTTLIVMLIWVGGSSNTTGAAVIAGFPTLAACEHAKPRVHKFYDGTFRSADIECADLAN